MKINKYFLIVSGIVLIVVAILLFPDKKNSKSDIKKSAYNNIWVIDKDQFSDMVNNRNGRILFVNVWATWCIPCIEEFPDVIKLHNTFSNKPVDFVSLNVNLLSEKDSLVVPFLEKNNSNLDVYMAKDDDVDALLDVMGKDWSGAVPVTYIFNREGKRKVSILGKRDYKFFKASIDSLISR